MLWLKWIRPMGLKGKTSDVTSIPNKPIDASKLKSTGVDNLSEPKNVPAASNDRDGDRDNSIGKDNVSLSQEALRLSSTSVAPAISNQTQIADQEKAKEAATKAAEAIRNNPGQAQTALSSVSSSTVNKLLSESFLAA